MKKERLRVALLRGMRAGGDVDPQTRLLKTAPSSDVDDLGNDWTPYKKLDSGIILLKTGRSDDTGYR